MTPAAREGFRMQRTGGRVRRRENVSDNKNKIV